MLLPGFRFERAYTLFRRPSRIFTIVATFLIIFHLYTTTFPDAPNFLSRLKFEPSTYDWASWTPRYPPEPDTLQFLPTVQPKKYPSIQHPVSRVPEVDVALQERRRQEVKRVALKAWNNYREHAWLYDELTPLTGGATNPFGGWAATLVDSLDTLWIMGLKKEFHEAAQAAVKIDWAKTKSTACNIFETTIRHLGGLLSAYDLSKERALLAKAVELGDMLYSGFDTPNHLPPFWLDFEKAKTGKLIADDRQAAASATTLSMEFTRLAQLTGNHKYYDAVARVTDHLFRSQNLTKLPGIWPAFFNLRTAELTHEHTFTLGGLSDSMYEYVLKMNLLLGGTEPKYEQLYRTAANTIAEKLLFRPMTPKNLDILFTGTYRVGDDEPLDPEGQHLACFAGGMFAMGGRMFDIPEHVEIGAKLTHGCIWAYNAFMTGLSPEIFKLVPCKSLSGCEWDEQKWIEALYDDSDGRDSLPRGFVNARDPRYILRPEALESVFILYRITGHEEYRETAWRMFQSIQKATETEFGNAAVRDVTVQGTPELSNSMESFWLAETLKYLYLIFSPADTVSLDEFVLNTECHPFRIPKP